MTVEMDGQRLTLAELRHMTDNATGLSPRQQRNLEGLLHGYEQDLATRQITAYQEAAQRNSDLYSTLMGDAEGLKKMADDVTHAIRTGSMPAAEGRRTLTGIFKAIGQVREQVGALRQSEANAWSQLQRDPAEVQGELLNKYPRLRDSLPIFNDRMLTE
jgi:hypothetical protein